MMIGNSKINNTSINASDIPNLTIERIQIPPEFIWFGALGPKPYIISYIYLVDWAKIRCYLIWYCALSHSSMWNHFFLRPWPKHNKVADLWWLRPPWKPKYIEKCSENEYFQYVGQDGTKMAPRSPKISSMWSNIARTGPNTAPRWSIAAPA